MFIFFISFFFYFLILELTPISDILYDQDLLLSNTYIYIFFLSIYLNFFSNKNEYKYKLNIDLIYKYFLIFIKTPSYLFNYILNNFKKIYLYLFYFKYKNIYYTIYIFSKKYLNFFIWWRPLFKKSSYFGYYRSNRSKWIK